MRHVGHQLHAALLATLQRLRHDVERSGQLADLARSPATEPLAVLPTGDAAAGVREGAQGPNQPPGDVQPDDAGRDCGRQQRPQQ